MVTEPFFFVIKRLINLTPVSSKVVSPKHDVFNWQIAQVATPELMKQKICGAGGNKT